MIKYFLGFLIILSIFVYLFGVSTHIEAYSSRMKSPEVQYVALGDSYTYGTGSSNDESFPLLLTNNLRENGINIKLTDNLGRPGWTSQQLLTQEIPMLLEEKPNFVTLLIGTNDIVYKTGFSNFQSNFIQTLNILQSKLTSNIVVLSLPDFAITPRGKDYSNDEEIIKYNDFIERESLAKGFAFVNLFSLSHRMEIDSSLVSNDGMHPSIKEYEIWEKEVYKSAYKILTPSFNQYEEAI